MGVGKILHYVGSFVLFAAMILAIVVNISAPVTDTIALMEYDGLVDSHASFGVFGYCETNVAGESSCSGSSIGYNPAAVLERIGQADFTNARMDTTEALTNVFVLHPIGAGVLFLAFLLSLVSGSTVLSILAMLASFLAFIINAVAVIIDFVVFSLVKNEVEDSDSTGSAEYGAGIFIALVAAALALVGTILMLVTCCAGRKQRRREKNKMMASY